MSWVAAAYRPSHSLSHSLVHLQYSRRFCCYQELTGDEAEEEGAIGRVDEVWNSVCRSLCPYRTSCRVCVCTGSRGSRGSGFTLLLWLGFRERVFGLRCSAYTVVESRGITFFASFCLVCICAIWKRARKPDRGLQRWLLSDPEIGLCCCR